MAKRNAMKSHECEFAASEILKLLGSVLWPLGLFALVMHLGVLANVWPRPLPTSDTDRTILLHQAAASRSTHDADLLLIGDSSCLMDVSAPLLGPALPGGRRALNLGTLSYLDLTSYAAILRQHFAANPGRVRTVVLLMHPEALRRAAPEEHHEEILGRYYAGLDYCDPATPSLVCWMGGVILKGRLLSRCLPVPLAGAYGQKYGFTAGLWDYLDRHQGSAIDPRKFEGSAAQGNAEYQLSPRLEHTSQAFRSAIPPGVRLHLGITPAPESFVRADYPQRHAEMLRQLGTWLRADATLANLPATMPDERFASTTHLNEAGQRIFTEMLASEFLIQRK